MSTAIYPHPPFSYLRTKTNKLYACWRAMVRRCHNPNDRRYEDYGGRGIRVCSEWRESFEAFVDWAAVSGYDADLQLDRRDNSQGYSPDNCRWATRREQTNNRRDNVTVTAFGETKTVAQWIEDPRCSVAHDTLLRRVQTGSWGPEEAILTPAQRERSYPVVSDNPAVQAHYILSRRRGTSHNLAIMFALQAPPQIAGTDSVFLEGHANGSQFDGQEYVGEMYKAEATRAGVDTKGKVYLGGLARYPGDPEAWVTGRGDVKRVCEQRGWGCDGAVKVKAAEPLTPPESVGLAEDIVDDKVVEILEHVPERERARVDVQELKEQVREKMTPSWSKE